MALFTAPTGGARLWNGTLSLALASGSAYTGPNLPFCSLYYASAANIFAVIQGAATVGGQMGLVSMPLALNGFEIPGGDTVYLGINGGTTIPDLNIVAGVAFTYSTP